MTFRDRDYHFFKAAWLAIKYDRVLRQRLNLIWRPAEDIVCSEICLKVGIIDGEPIFASNSVCTAMKIDKFRSDDA